MEKAAIEPDDDVEDEVIAGDVEPGTESVDEGKLSAFADFVNSLDLDLDEDDEK
jgi:hypothetical protein